MTAQTAFEVQCFKGDRWEIRSIFDDRHTALAEADRLERRGIKRLRVVQERMDGDCELVHSRTIYQTGTLDDGDGSSKVKKPKGTKAHAASGEETPVQIPQQAGRRATDKDSLPRILVTAALLLAAGVGALFALRSI